MIMSLGPGYPELGEEREMQFIHFVFFTPVQRYGNVEREEIL